MRPQPQAIEGTTIVQTARGPVDVDSSIADLAWALNTAGFETIASCSGHGHRPGNIALRDGRELIIARDYADARRIDLLFPIDSSGQRTSATKALAITIAHIVDPAAFDVGVQMDLETRSESMREAITKAVMIVSRIQGESGPSTAPVCKGSQ